MGYKEPNDCDDHESNKLRDDNGRNQKVRSMLGAEERFEIGEAKGFVKQAVKGDAGDRGEYGADKDNDANYSELEFFLDKINCLII